MGGATRTQARRGVLQDVGKSFNCNIRADGYRSRLLLIFRVELRKIGVCVYVCVCELLLRSSWWWEKKKNQTTEEVLRWTW